MRHLECQLEEKNQELLRVSHGGGGRTSQWCHDMVFQQNV